MAPYKPYPKMLYSHWGTTRAHNEKQQKELEDLGYTTDPTSLGLSAEALGALPHQGKQAPDHLAEAQAEAKRQREDKLLIAEGKLERAEHTINALQTENEKLHKLHEENTEENKRLGAQIEQLARAVGHKLTSGDGSEKSDTSEQSEKTEQPPVETKPEVKTGTSGARKPRSATITPKKTA